MDIRPLFTENAPKPIGPYSQAMDCGSFVFLSGQIAIDPSTNQVTGTTVAEQTRQVLSNIKAVLVSAGLSFTSIAKATVFLTDMGTFGEFNGVYDEMMQGWKPARSLVEVSCLPKNVLVEIEVVACR